MISTFGSPRFSGESGVPVEVPRCTSRLLASCCLVCLLVPVASLAQPKNAKTASVSRLIQRDRLGSPAYEFPTEREIAFNKGAQRLAAKDFAGSITEFQKAIAAYDDFYEAYYKIGIANLELQTSERRRSRFP